MALTSRTGDPGAIITVLIYRQHDSNPLYFAKKVLKEYHAGRLLSPFKTSHLPYLQCSPMGLVLKKGKPGKYHMIMDLSSPRGNSINTYIPKEVATVNYKPFDYVVQLIIYRRQISTTHFIRYLCHDGH